MTPRNDQNGQLGDLKRPAAELMNRQEWQQRKINIQTGWEAQRQTERRRHRLSEKQTDGQTPKTEVIQTVWMSESLLLLSSDHLCSLLFCQRGTVQSSSSDWLFASAFYSASASLFPQTMLPCKMTFRHVHPLRWVLSCSWKLIVMKCQTASQRSCNHQVQDILFSSVV